MTWKTEVLFYLIPLIVLPVLVALGNTELWSGFPFTYTYETFCGLGSCLSIGLIPFFLDWLFYTGLGYGLLIVGSKYHSRGKVARQAAGAMS